MERLPRYAALLRAIAHVPMAPFRRKLERLGFADVASFGMSGNLVFTAPRADAAALERRIGGALDAVAFVRTRPEVARAVSEDPFRGQPGASMVFLARRPTSARRRAFGALDWPEPGPVVRGRTLYVRWPALPRGRRTPVDLERAFGMPATARSSKVVEGVLARMDEG